MSPRCVRFPDNVRKSKYRQPVSIDEYENIGRLTSLICCLSCKKDVMFLPSLRRWSVVSRAKMTSLMRKLYPVWMSGEMIMLCNSRFYSQLCNSINNFIYGIINVIFNPRNAVFTLYHNNAIWLVYEMLDLECFLVSSERNIFKNPEYVF